MQVSEVFTIHPEENMNICAKFQGKLSITFQNMKLFYTVYAWDS